MAQTIKDLEQELAAVNRSLEEAQDNFQRVLYKAVDAVLIIDQGRFVDCNEATVSMLHATDKAQVLSTHPSELSPEFQRDGSRSFDKAELHMANALRDGFNRFEWTHTRLDGENFPVEVSLTVIRQDGRQVIHTYWKDLSSQYEHERALQFAREEAERSNCAKSLFLANMSHEIRTPMNGLLGMLDSVLRSRLEEQQRVELEIAQASGQSLLVLLNDILDFSKMEAGKLKLESLVFDLFEVFEHSFDSVISLAEKKGLQLNLELNSSIHCHVLGDPSRLRQVLVNLLDNAIKFTSNGRIVVRGMLFENGSNHWRLECEVEDTGIGICSEKAEEIFASFRQADASTTRKYGGSGLGLSICTSLVNLMGGSIDATGAEGKGSCFRFNIILGKSTSHIAECRDSRAEKEKVAILIENIFWPDSSRLLVVEDNRVNQMVVGNLLKSFGLPYELAENGEAALASLRKSPPQMPFTLILMDGQMPVIDGYQATELIRNGSTGEHYRDIPIIALTAHAMAGDREKCFDAGMNDYLSKPVSAEMLLKKLQLFLS